MKAINFHYIHSATDQHLICVETHEKVYVDFPTMDELFMYPNIVKEREMAAIEIYESLKEAKFFKEELEKC